MAHGFSKIEFWWEVERLLVQQLGGNFSMAAWWCIVDFFISSGSMEETFFLYYGVEACNGGLNFNVY